MNTVRSSPALLQVWSPLLRVLHWTLAGSMIASFVTHEGGGRVHEWTGFQAVGFSATIPLAFLLVLMAGMPAIDDLREMWRRGQLPR